MARYRKKPVEIEAVRWTGENVDEVKAFLAGHDTVGQVAARLPIAVWNPGRYRVDVPVGHWIVRNSVGGLSSCSPAVFAETYEPVGS